MELASFLHSSAGGWLLLGFGVIHTTIGFLIIFRDWNKEIPRMARYTKRWPSIKVLPLMLAMTSFVGFSVWIILAFTNDHTLVAGILMGLGVLQLLAFLGKRLYRPLNLPAQSPFEEVPRE
jgi:hypothetical protein